MKQCWNGDKEWSDRFLPQIKRELGEFLLSPAPIEEDMRHNTDLIVLKMDSVRIACRIRKPSFFDSVKFRNEFTIRSKRPSGAITELTKIIEGWGDYMFYGFSDKRESALRAWRIVSLNKFRLWFNRSMAANAGKIPGERHNNTDGSSSFLAFNVKDMPECIVREHGFNEIQDEDNELGLPFFGAKPARRPALTPCNIP